MPNHLTLAAFMALGLGAVAYAQEVPPSVKASVARAEKEIAAIIKVPKAKRTVANTSLALDDAITRLESDTSIAIFLQNVSPDAKVRDQARAAEEYVNNFEIDLGKREDLFRAFQELVALKPKVSGEDKRFIDFTMRDFRRAGMALPKAKRNRVAAIEKELEKLSIEFERNIAEDQTKLPLGINELKGVPEDLLKRQPKVGDIYLMGFDGPTYGAVMDYCEVDATRQKMQWLYRRRGGQRNVDLLEKLLPLRWELATTLGYKNLVDYVLEPRMAKNAESVRKFYEGLRPIVRKKADQDWSEFEAAKRERVGDPNAVFNPWDYSFMKNYLMRTKYAVDSRKVAEYFPMDQVVQGLFAITEKLYGVKMTDVTAKATQLGLPTWHEEVKLYEFKDQKTGQLIGYMFTDLFPRDNKYSHAACWGLKRDRVYSDGKKDPAVCALVCNFSRPTAGKPSLLPHDEVETFFHEFGHGLHNLFGKAKYGRFSGTSVARDFVEAPSQMMENWVWSPEVLRTFAKHYQTGEVIPDALIQGMTAARTLGSGIETEGQEYLGNMDQAFHLAPGGKVDTTTVAKEVYDKWTHYKALPGTFYQASFGHLTGYEGAYYGYLWSLVYAQDMFQRFEEHGVLNPESGMYYRSKVLSRGGTMDEMDMLRDYLGREPKFDAFYKHLGLNEK